MFENIDFWQLAYLYYLILGCFAGVIAGLLGVGGGIIIVPALLWIFTVESLATEHIMQVAIGTSLATIVVTSISSIRAHQKHNAILWQDFRHIVPGIIVGTLIGANISDELGTKVLQIIFACFMFFSSTQMIFGRGATALIREEGSGSVAKMSLAGSLIGTVSALMGIAGGSLTVPYFKRLGVPLKNAVATSAATGFPLACIGAISFAITGLDESGLPPLSLGYIYWPAFILIVIPSAICAPFGARLAHSMPTKKLKLFFAAFLILVGLKMLLG